MELWPRSCVKSVMSTDVSSAATSSPAPNPVSPVVIPLNHPEPIGTGMRVPVQRVPVAELPVLADAGPGPVRKFRMEPAVLERMLIEVTAALEAQRRENLSLRQQIADLLRQRYARRDEWSPEQPPLIPELHPDAQAAGTAIDSAASASAVGEAAEAAPEPPTKKKRKGKPHGRRRLQELLPRLPAERVEHPLTEAERVCPCCGELRCKIGEQKTQQLEYIPARLVRLEHVQFTYSCPHCPEHIVTAPKPPQPIDRGLPGPGLLAAIVTHKYDEHQPLYRQELSLWRDGLFLSRSTTCTWLAESAELLRPLVERMKQHIFLSRFIQTDSTPVSVLVEGERTARTGHLWPYLGDAEHPYVVFDFSTDRKKEHALAFVGDYRGYVQADACSGYDILFAPSSGRTEVGCWAHAQRYFSEARDSDPLLACQALGFIGTLFQIETRARDDGLSVDQVHALRQREAVPILADFKNWLDAHRDQALPKSPTGAAFTYVRNQWQALNRYTEAGFLPIDNNATERMNKLIARGRNNWLFLGSPRGGQTAAVLFSITATCRRLHMDAFAYLRDLFLLLPTPDRRPLPPARLDELLPDRWLASHPEARYPPERHRGGASAPRNPASLPEACLESKT
jgi:transposase